MEHGTTRRSTRPQTPSRKVQEMRDHANDERKQKADRKPPAARNAQRGETGAKNASTQLQQQRAADAAARQARQEESRKRVERARETKRVAQEQARAREAAKNLELQNRAAERKAQAEQQRQANAAKQAAAEARIREFENANRMRPRGPTVVAAPAGAAPVTLSRTGRPQTPSRRVLDAAAAAPETAAAPPVPVLAHAARNPPVRGLAALFDNVRPARLIQTSPAPQRRKSSRSITPTPKAVAHNQSLVEQGRSPLHRTGISLGALMRPEKKPSAGPSRRRTSAPAAARAPTSSAAPQLAASRKEYPPTLGGHAYSVDESSTSSDTDSTSSGSTNTHHTPRTRRASVSSAGARSLTSTSENGAPAHPHSDAMDDAARDVLGQLGGYSDEEEDARSASPHATNSGPGARVHSPALNGTAHEQHDGDNRSTQERDGAPSDVNDGPSGPADIQQEPHDGRRRGGRGRGRGRGRRGARRSAPVQYSSYIYRVLKQVHRHMGCSKQAMHVANDMTKDLLDRLLEETRVLLQKEGLCTAKAHDLRHVTRMVLRGELAEHANAEAKKAIAKFAPDAQVW